MLFILLKMRGDQCQNNEKFYINGAWCDPVIAKKFDIIHPGNEEIIASISMGSEADVNMAVDAAREAFKSWQFSTVEDRVALLERILSVYESRAGRIC
jgi:aldehyde dehydrogenase (NAD+)